MNIINKIEIYNAVNEVVIIVKAVIIEGISVIVVTETTIEIIIVILILEKTIVNVAEVSLGTRVIRSAIYI